MVAELVLAVFGTIDVCIRLGNKTVQAYRAFRDADVTIEEKLVIVDAVWTRLEVQLTALRKVYRHLGEELAKSQYFLLQKLQGKLQQADAQLDMPESKILRRFKLSVVKKELDELIAELEAWQKRFDPTWFLVILIGNSAIDSELAEGLPCGANKAPTQAGPLQSMTALRHAIRQSNHGSELPGNNGSSVNLDASGLTDAKILPIPYSAARIVIRKGSNKILIAESVESIECEISQVKLLVENLARRLKQVDTDTFCLLQCYGILKHRDPANPRAITGIDVIYRTPSQSQQPTSLRQLLLQQQAVSVSAKIKIAKQLVQSVLYVHTCDFVHKGIRPENILVFPEESSKLGSSFLVGFNQFRESHFQTNLRGDACWHRNLYRHPQRQGRFVVDRYVMQHDIYSLGVCLLEIGLWGSFVWYPNSSNGVAPVPGLALKLNLCDDDFDSVHSAAMGQTKDHLVGLAKSELPSRVGDLFTRIAVACLTCLDPGNTDFGTEEELQDEDGVLVGVRFVEKIVLKMEDISV